MDIKEQQDISKKVIRILQENIDKYAIIAGGACRNWLEGKEARDVDIYINNPEILNPEKKLKELFGVDGELQVTKFNYELGGAIEIMVMYDLEYDGVNFQIICCEISNKKDLAHRVIKHIDTGINKVRTVYSSTLDKLSFIKSEEYYKDIHDNTITLYINNLSDNQLLHSVRHHIPKMLKYYPDKRLIINTQDGGDQPYDIF